MIEKKGKKGTGLKKSVCSGCRVVDNRANSYYNNHMKKLPLGIQTFPEMIGENYLYVDKTKEIYNLTAEGGKYYFLSRPRRFGKSLLISTLKELFSGNKDLFKGLWIHDKWEWEKHPVIHLDFLGQKSGSEKDLIASLERMVNRNAKEHGIELKEKDYGFRFEELIIELSRINRVVILVDEYDKPIIDNLRDLDVAAKNRDIFKILLRNYQGFRPLSEICLHHGSIKVFTCFRIFRFKQFNRYHH